MSECSQMLRRELKIDTTPEVEGWNGAPENNGSLVLHGQVAGSCGERLLSSLLRKVDLQISNSFYWGLHFQFSSRLVSSHHLF